MTNNSAIATRAFWVGFGLSGLFGHAKLPGGAETLVEETPDLSESQFAELLMPFSKVKPCHAESIAPFAETEEAETAKKAESTTYADVAEWSCVDEEILAHLERLGVHVDVESIRQNLNRPIAQILNDRAKPPTVQAPTGSEQKKRA